MIRLRRLAVSLLAVPLGAGALVGPAEASVTSMASTAPSAPVPFSGPLEGDITLTGRGFGHGWGMSQVGAYGYAAEFGWSKAQILSHYYGGTVAATVPTTETISVRLLFQNGRQTSVVQLTRQARLAGSADTYGALVARPVAPGSLQFDVWAHADPVCAPTGPLGDSWVKVAGPVTNPAFEWAGDTPAHNTAERANLLGVCEADGAVRFLRGIVRAVGQGDPRNGAAPGTVNEVRIEQYLRSVISKEMSPSWGSASNGGMAALEAQAVAARSYALASSYQGTLAKTCDTTRCQVYAGAARRAPGAAGLSSNEHSLTDTAVTATAGEIRRVASSGAIATTFYAAASGGWTDTLAGHPFSAVQDLGDALVSDPAWAQKQGVSWAVTWHRWTATLPVTRVEQAWPAIGRLTGFTVVERNGLGEWGGRVRTLRIHGTSGDVNVSGDAFQSRMGLRSNWFSLDPSTARVCDGTEEPTVVGPLGHAPAARFAAVTPTRLVDTREGLGAPRGRLGAGCTIRVVPPVPGDATAVVVNVTTVNVVGRGFVTAYPCGTPRPWISTSQTAPQRVTPSTSVVPLGHDGSFCVYSPIPANVVVDLFGYYSPNATGRFSALDPGRVYDSRSASYGGPGPLAAGAIVPVQVAGVRGVPAAGVEAVAVTVHAIAGAQQGYVTAYPCGGTPPYTSIVNVLAGQAMANHGQVRLDASGRLCVFVSGAIDVMIDVTGWFGPGGETDFYAVQPARAVDTRVSQGIPGRLAPRTDTPFTLAGRANVPPGGASAVIATVTMVSVATPSHVTLHPCLSSPPGIGMVRNLPPQHAATAALIRLDGQGRWCAHAGTDMDLLVDVVGWYG